MDCQKAQENLLALLDGELEEPDRANVAIHVEFCPDCAREMERLQALRGGLTRTISAGWAALHLSPEADQRIKVQLRRGRAPPGLAVLFAALLRPRAIKMAIPLVAVMILAAGLALGTRPLALSAHETLVVAPHTWALDTDVALRVIVRQKTLARPISNAQIDVRLQPDGEREVVLYRGETDQDGTAQIRFHIPAYDQERLPAELVIETSSPYGESQIVQPVILAHPLRIYFYSDKPAYRPGQAIHQRAVVLDAAHRLPAVGQMVHFSASDPTGEPIWEESARTSDYGIAAVDWTLAADAEPGTYRLRAAIEDTISERTVLVGAYERPPFQIELSTAAYYLSGQKAAIHVTARALDGTPLPGAQVVLQTAVSDLTPGPGADAQGQTDKNGIAVLDIAVPQNVGSETAQWLLQAKVTDQMKQVSSARRVVPLTAQPLIIDLVAEGGQLQPGIENLLYVLTATPDGTPVSAQVTLALPDGLRTLQTDVYGLATLHYRPEPGTQRVEIDATAADDQGRTATHTAALSASDAPAQVLLRLDRAAYELGETMHVDVLAPQGKTAYIDLVGQGDSQALYTAQIALRDGKGTLEVDLTSEMVGTVTVHAYQVLADGGLVQDARPAVIDAPQDIRVRFRLDRPVYHPGDVARVDIDTALEDVPAQSALGIAIVDESAFALEKRTPGFAKLFFLLDAALRKAAEGSHGLEWADLLDPPNAAVRAAQDLAARAAWAGLPVSDLAVVRASAGPAPESGPAQQMHLVLVAALVLLALGLWIVVIGWVGDNDLPGSAVGRAFLLLAGAATAVALPAGAFVAAQLGRLSGALAGQALLVFLGVAWLGAFGALGLAAWRRRDDRLQIAVLLIGAYGALGALMGYLAEQSGGPSLTLLLIVAASLLLLLLALLGLSASLWLGERRGAATLAATLVLLALAVLVLAGLVLDLSSFPIEMATAQPANAGPLGWLTGRQPQAASGGKEATPQAQETIETPTATPIQPPLSPTAAPAGAAQSLPLLEPLDPETIYWVPEAVTNRDGHLELSIALPERPATWRLTALASTQQGQLGAGTAILLVRAPAPISEGN